MRGMRWLARPAGRQPAPPRPAPAILMYHRIATPLYDPWGLAVSPAHFADQLLALKSARTVLPLDDFARGVRKRSLPDNALAITFDDAARDNMTDAAPMLEKAGLPATFFLPTGLLGKGEFWWEELARLVLLSPHPLRATIEVDGLRCELVLDERPAPEAIRAWRASDPDPPPRQATYLRLWEALRPLPASRIEGVIARLRDLLPDAPGPDLSSFPMTAEEVRSIGARGHVSLQAHTATHPDLLTLSKDECRAEIEASRDACAAITGRRTTGFAYPYGRRDAAVRKIARAAGFDWACSTRGGSVYDNGADLFDLPRLPVADIDGDALLRELHH